jgi:hypothetical protein
VHPQLKYLPQEIIKKICYFIYHPKVIKFRLQVIHIFRKSFGLRASVAVEEHVEVRRGRYTVIVSTMLDDVANEIVGKQVKEYQFSSSLGTRYTTSLIIYIITYM